MAPDTADLAALLDALRFQYELGADEAMGETPLNRFTDLAAPAVIVPPATAAPPAAVVSMPAAAGEDPASLAAACVDLAALRAAMDAWPSPLREGAQHLVFADGNPQARVMIIGEAPGRDEDAIGKPFVGRSGQLLDRMLAAIGLDRAATDPTKAAYITNIIPWRPLANRTPGPDEVLPFLPFLARHIDLINPRLILTMGGVAARHVLNIEHGIMRSRGQWGWSVLGATKRPVLPTLHPAYLLRSPDMKRLAWRDLLAARLWLDGAIDGPN